MDPRLVGPAAIFDLNTDLLLNAVRDVDDALAHRRLEGGGNTIAFQVAHLIDVRHHLVSLLGAPLENPLAPILDGARSLDDVGTLPPMEELKEAWRAVAAHLRSVLDTVDADALSAPTSIDFPVPGGTAFEAVVFLAQHDAYHLGQVAFLRRRFGLPAMGYDRHPPT